MIVLIIGIRHLKPYNCVQTNKICNWNKNVLMITMKHLEMNQILALNER